MIQHTLESLSGLSDGTYTIDSNGSVQEVGSSYVSGYFVGVRPLTEDQIEPSVMFGVWTDPASDPFSPIRTIDLVHWDCNLAEATYWGKRYSQKVIWDVAKMEEIYL